MVYHFVNFRMTIFQTNEEIFFGGGPVFLFCFPIYNSVYVYKHFTINTVYRLCVYVYKHTVIVFMSITDVKIRTILSNLSNLTFNHD